MKKAIYRNLLEDDYEVAKILIGEAFGFNEFIKDKKFLNLMLESYLKEFLKIKNVYDEIIKDRRGEFQEFIQLFIVSKESRGLGVGKTLVNYLFDYMKRMDVKSLYLYTDTRCSYGFYYSQNFKRLRERELYFDLIKTKLDVFLYEYYSKITKVEV